ncbi:MAG: putative DNA-binding domain-containing protein [Rickettsiales bacterium]|nr:putative DNA-binding domain-containing protein [Rickettsiales bacterium]
MTKKTSNLLKLQKDFTTHLLSKNDLEILKSLSYSTAESLARLEIYRNNVFGNFDSVLSSVFEVVKKILGEKDFNKFVSEYIKKFPSTSGNLDLYGDNFLKFIKGKLKTHKLAYLEDLAKLELLYHKAYFAKDVKKKFDVEKFQKLTSENYNNLTLELHPSCFLFSSKFPIFTIWKSAKKKIAISGKEEYVLIDRVFDSCLITKLSKEEFLFLSLIESKKKLYAIYKKLCSTFKKEVDIGKLLNKFIASGVISAFKTN